MKGHLARKDFIICLVFMVLFISGLIVVVRCIILVLIRAIQMMVISVLLNV